MNPEAQKIVASEARRLARLPLARARAEWSSHVARAGVVPERERGPLLSFNAHLATALREGGVKIWADE